MEPEVSVLVQSPSREPATGVVSVPPVPSSIDLSGELDLKFKGGDEDNALDLSDLDLTDEEEDVAVADSGAGAGDGGAGPSNPAVAECEGQGHSLMDDDFLDDKVLREEGIRAPYWFREPTTLSGRRLTMDDSGVSDPDIAGGAVMCTLFPQDMEKIRHSSTPILVEDLSLCAYRCAAASFGAGRRLTHLLGKNKNLRQEKKELKKEIADLQAKVSLLAEDRLNKQLDERNAQLLEAREEIQRYRSQAEAAEAARIRDAEMKDELLRNTVTEYEGCQRDLAAATSRVESLEAELVAVKADFAAKYAALSASASDKVEAEVKRRIDNLRQRKKAKIAGSQTPLPQ